MTTGARVRVLPGAGYNDRFAGRLGVVVYYTELCASKIGVQLDSVSNPRSKYNAFWLDIDYLEIIESEETFMIPNYILVTVRFLDGSNTNMTYSYACYDLNILEGDLVVVKTGHHGFALAKVAEVAPEFAEPVKFGREVVARVDLSEYEARKAQAKRLAEVKASMDAKVKELQAFAVYELLAEKDPALKNLLAEFKQLSGMTEEKEETENV